MSQPNYLPAIAPLRIMTLATLLGVLVIIAALWVVQRGPWLGVEFAGFDPAGGLRVGAVAHGPAEAILRAGDVVRALRGADGPRVVLGPLIALEEPDSLPSFAEYDRFFLHQGAVWDVLQGDRLELELADGRHVGITPQPSRPLRDLSLDFWASLLLGFLSWLLGVGVWSFRRGEIATRLLALAGFGFLPATSLAAVYASRELVMEPELFRALACWESLALMVYSFSICALLWYYPRRLGSFSAVIPFSVFLALAWVNERWQWWDLPLHSFYIPFLIIYTIALWFGVQQWRATREFPLERAALRWWLLSVYISFGLAICFYFLPSIFAGGPMISLAVGYSFGFIVYLGLTLGILRYRLFDLDRWWLMAWVWLIAGAMILAIDGLLVYLTQFTTATSLGLAVLMAGFVYFPLRQWLLGRLALSPERRLEKYFPLLVETLLAGGDYHTRWRQLLERVFEPIHVQERADTGLKAQLVDNGLTLHIPDLLGEGMLELGAAQGGRRLYAPADARLADSLLELSRQSVALREQQEQQVQRERERIMRDLHDDVGARLLTLAQRAVDPVDEGRARDALRSLRETIFSLDSDASAPLADVLADVRLDTAQRLEQAGIVMAWPPADAMPEAILNPRQQVNLRRMAQEMVSNVLKHARAVSRVEITVDLHDGVFSLQLCDDGDASDIEQWLPGRGLNNIRTRARELEGEARWWGRERSKQGRDATQQSDQQTGHQTIHEMVYETVYEMKGRGCCVAIHFPL